MQRFACMSETETGCICVLEKPFNAGNIQLTIVCAFLYTERAAYVGLRYASMNASVGLRHARMNASGGLRHADPFSRTCFCVVKRRQIISSGSCHRTLWAALRSQGRPRTCCQVAENSGETKFKR